MAACESKKQKKKERKSTHVVEGAFDKHISLLTRDKTWTLFIDFPEQSENVLC